MSYFELSVGICLNSAGSSLLFEPVVDIEAARVLRSALISNLDVSDGTKAAVGQVLIDLEMLFRLSVFFNVRFGWTAETMDAENLVGDVCRHGTSTIPFRTKWAKRL